MKKLFTLALLATGLMTTISVNAQEDKSKRKSPPATVTETVKNGATITINYSQPAVNSRTIGKDLEPIDGQLWRTGANEATIFETSKDIKVNGRMLPAGKYSLFTLFNGGEVTMIFNKTWEQWGSYDYKAADDQLRVMAKVKKGKDFTERMTFNIDDDGEVELLWGDRKVEFKVD